MVEKIETVETSEAGSGAGYGGGTTREALLKAYDAEEADALLELEQKFDGADQQKMADELTVAHNVTAATVRTNGA